MEKFEEGLENLKAAVESVQDYFKKPENFDLEYLVTMVVCPVLRDVLNDLCPRIEERHKIDESASRQDKFIIHYTSIAALVSMLQDASKGDNKSSLRLYDSVHLNDPDEGNYLALNLLPQKYNWLGKTGVRHAYIASFILPTTESEKDVISDDLVFWQAYGQEGAGCSLSLHAPLPRLRTVFYDPKKEKVKHTVKELQSILELLDPLVAIDNSSRESIKKKLAETVWKPLERIRYLYKSKAYKHENECRFVLLEANIDKDKICFEYQDRNNSPARIRHYYEHEDFQIKDLMKSSSSITLGPCVPYRDDVKYCIKTLTDRVYGISPEIKYSEINYRNS